MTTMQENVELVQKGFRILVGTMSGYICRELKRLNRDSWWSDVLYTLNDQRDLPSYGEDADLVDSLDIANCIRLFTRKWNEVFAPKQLSPNCRTYANELMGVRNVVAHLGQKDLDHRDAERALDTMARLCMEIDKDTACEIQMLYNEMRERTSTGSAREPIVVYRTVEQPVSDATRTPQENSLLKYVGTEYVQETSMTRKVTFGGKTVVYPVYRVRLDCLYYNDQNDRIATWISRYEAENGDGSLYDIDVGIYNSIIESFIYESNPEALNRTQKNIALVGQREPGVTLADGRVVDGNRRFTCLRRLQQTSTEPLFFETVLLDMDIYEDRKQIKLLELSIQHGEESKVGYDLIDYAVGTYRDIIQTGLLTVEEYAQSTGESISDVKKRLEVAQLVTEFLAYIRLPGQYYVARDYQVYELFHEMLAPLKKLNDDEKKQLKSIAFSNAMLKAIPDQRKFIRDIKGLVSHNAYGSFFAEQQEQLAELTAELEQTDIHSREEVDHFAQEHQYAAQKLRQGMERALLVSRTQELKNKPAETVNRCISLMMDVDPRLFSRLDTEEKQELISSMDELAAVIDAYKKQIG